MNLRSQILAGAVALAIGGSLVIPTTVRADDWWHHHDSYNGSWWHRDHDHDQDDRSYGWSHNRDRGYYNPNAGRNIPENGEGMISRRNPNYYWACDSHGHHCHWARR